MALSGFFGFGFEVVVSVFVALSLSCWFSRLYIPEDALLFNICRALLSVAPSIPVLGLGPCKVVVCVKPAWQTDFSFSGSSLRLVPLVSDVKRFDASFSMFATRKIVASVLSFPVCSAAIFICHM